MASVDTRISGTDLAGLSPYAWMLGEIRWCTWRWEERGGKPTKVPMVAGTGYNLRSNQVDAGRSYEVARAAVLDGQAGEAGVGWLLTGETRLCWLDLDRCRDPATGELAAWAWAILDRCHGTTWEVTPSGTGIRIWGLARLEEYGSLQGRVPARELPRGEDASDGAAVELFHCCSRFVCVTGWDGAGFDDVDIGDVFLELWELSERRRAVVSNTDDRKSIDDARAPAPLADIVAALEAMRNDDVSWDEWSRVGMAAHAASGGDAGVYEAWAAWSALSWKHDEDACRERWAHWERSPATELGFGTLWYLAREATPGWLPPSRGPAAVFSVRPEVSYGREKSTVGDEQRAGAFEGLASQLIHILDAHRFLDRERMMLLDEVRVTSIAGIMKLREAFVRGKRGLIARLMASPLLRTVDTVVVRPGAGEIVEDQNEYGVTVSAANLWRPSTLVPARGKDARIWLEHCKKLIPNEADRERVLSWLAWALQNPGRKINNALVLLGGQGTGKDTLIQPFWKAIGTHNMAWVPGVHIGGEFNEYLQKAWVLIAEMPHARKRSSYEEIKSWLTVPPSHIRVNLKGLKAFYIPNVVNVIVTTNHAGAIAMAEDDRRFDVIQTVMPVPREEEAGYFDRLWRWYEAGGYEAVAGWLLDRDVAGFNPNVAPPVTEAKETMRREGAHPIVSWVMRLWSEGGPLESAEIITQDEVMALARLEGGSTIHPAFAREHVLTALRLGGWSWLPVRIEDSGRRVRPWVRSKQFDLMRQMQPRALSERLKTDRAKRIAVRDF